jgi:hypothetical protein
MSVELLLLWVTLSVRRGPLIARRRTSSSWDATAFWLRPADKMAAHVRHSSNDGRMFDGRR